MSDIARPNAIEISGKTPHRMWLHLLSPILKSITIGRLTLTLPNGTVLSVQGAHPGPDAQVTLHRYRAIRRFILKGSIGFCEAHMDGDWSSPDLTALFRLGFANEETGLDLDGNWLTRLSGRISHGLRRNTKRRAKRNILAHYDLGNAFYQSWLDPSMTYSSAIWPTHKQDLPLQQAQTHKFSRIADLAAIKPGMRVLEIGCGWGGMANYLATERGAHVTALTLSEAQNAHVRDMIASQDLQNRIDLRLQDYRDLTDQPFDAIISIKMFEAVGEAYWSKFFNTLHTMLKPGGKAGLQIITIADQHFNAYRKRSDFIREYIFPGGMLPSVAALKQQTALAGLQIDALSNHASDYARTLACWAQGFASDWPKLTTLGFDDRFRAMWNLYLSGCEAGFAEDTLGLHQMSITRPQS
ncbi:MAG: cyclopropane-fatty-acyl-phospholipid synthase family protein [Alphaproteobacteria bacterium]